MTTELFFCNAVASKIICWHCQTSTRYCDKTKDIAEYFKYIIVALVLLSLVEKSRVIYTLREWLFFRKKVMAYVCMIYWFFGISKYYTCSWSQIQKSRPTFDICRWLISFYLSVHIWRMKGMRQTLYMSLPLDVLEAIIST